MFKIPPVEVIALNFGYSNLFRISDFELRVLIFLGAFARVIPKNSPPTVISA